MQQKKSGIHRALKALVISTMLVLMPTMAHALEVGKLFIYSRLYAPLKAEIQLISATEEDISSLVPSVSPPSNLSGTELANQPEIEVSVVTRADGQYSLRLISQQPLSEPILQFTLRTVWAEGYLVHDFSALVDPPNTLENAANQPEVSTRVNEPKPEPTPQPKQPVTPAEQSGAAAPEPASEPVALSPPRVLVEISPRRQDGPPITTVQSTATSSNGFDELGDNAEVQNPPAEPEVVDPIEEQALSETQPPLAQTQAAKGEQRTVSPKAKEAAAQPIKRVQQAQAPLAVVAKEQGAVDATTSFIRERPQWVLIFVAGLAGSLILIAGGLIFVVISLRRRNTTLEFKGKAPAPKVAVPKKAPKASEDESQTDGNGRRDDTSRRRQGRRTGEDRRKRSIPVAHDRRSGLSRRRSEILEGGKTTISSETLDPMAEADVYLSAGSYDHAEATLREALSADPERQELKVKLLQIYHQKGDLLAFNGLAEELREVLDRPSGELWKQLEANDWCLTDSTDGAEPTEEEDDAELTEEEIVLEAAEPERVNGDSLPDMGIGIEKTESEQDLYTIEFEPQGHSSVNTLTDAFDAFLQARKSLKARTIDNYKQVMEESFADWHKKTLLEISEDMIVERHQELWQQHGKAYANRAMRCLRTMYNFFSTHYRDASGKSVVPENPVKSLTQI